MKKPRWIAQFLFDKIVTHLRKQGRQSLDNNLYSRYLSPDGCRCAIGCLIPPEDYNPNFEGAIIYNLVNRLPNKLSNLFLPNISLLGDMQIVHDHITPVVWEKEFQRIAQVYGLTVPSP